MDTQQECSITRLIMLDSSTCILLFPFSFPWPYLTFFSWFRFIQSQFRAAAAAHQHHQTISHGLRQFPSHTKIPRILSHVSCDTTPSVPKQKQTRPWYNKKRAQLE
jgi:subtilase family serine protease